MHDRTSAWTNAIMKGLIVIIAASSGVACLGGEHTFEVTGTKPSPCMAEDFQGKARHVIQGLRDVHAAWEGTTWGISCENKLPGDFLLQTPAADYWGHDNVPKETLDKLPTETHCDPLKEDKCDEDFKLTLCDPRAPQCPKQTECRVVEATRAVQGEPARALCVGHAYFLYEEMYKVIANAERYVDIATLDNTTGSFLSALQNAISYLNDRSRGKSVSVRYLHGTPVTPWSDLQGDDGMVQRLLEKIRPGNPRIQISSATFNEGSRWNHAKIIAADGQHSIVGGINPWDDHYLQADKNMGPVHDLWLKVDGPAAVDAQNFVEWMWQQTCHKVPILVNSLPVPSIVNPCNDGYFKPSTTATPGPQGNTRIIAIGATGSSLTSSEPKIDRAGDEAIYAMIDTAETAVRLSQQDLVSIEGPLLTRHINRELAQHLYQAMLRGVDVYIVLSNPGSDYSSSYSAAQQAERLRNLIVNNVPGWGSPPAQYSSVDDLLCNRLHTAAFRSGDSHVNARNHAKLVMIDGDMFYIGSQNLYPGGISEDSFPGLAEFGYIVDSPEATATVMASYWDKLWSNSSSTAVNGSGTCLHYLGSDIVATSKKVGWGSYQVDANWYESGFTIGNVRYYKGIFAHAESIVTFPLGGRYSTLNTCVGLDDGDGNCGDGATVSVSGDGVELWSTHVNGGAATCMPAKSVVGVQTLTLTANQGTGNRCDEVEWVNARVD